MKSQPRRDEETVTIVAGLLLFLVVTAVGAVALVIAHQFVALNGELLNVFVYAVLGVAGVVSIRYIYRNRGR
jgi:predicted membrane channel-forming protein YqfA (hemolysin III family)